MRVLEYVVKDGVDGARACDYLRHELGFSYRSVTNLRKEMGLLTINGVAQRVVEKVYAGDKLCINILDDSMKSIPVSLPVEIAFEDEDVIVYNKPPFMPVHESKKHQDNTLANAFAAHCIQNGQSLVFRAVNRLDRDTSGLIVVAKHQHSAAMLSKGRIQKEYIAIVCGELSQETGTIDAPIRRRDIEEQLRIVSEDGQRAVTHYEVLRRGGGLSLVKLRLETGRTHQIRVHMAHIGYPLAGDKLYGGDLSMIDRQALHCSRLWFTNEITNSCIDIQCDLYEDMQKLAQKIH